MTNGGEIELEPADEAALTMWDRRMVSAIQTANAARKGVRLLRIGAGVVMALALLVQWLQVFAESGSQTFAFDEVSASLQWGQFLQGLVFPFVYAVLIVGLSYLLAVYAARLDMDIVLADDEEVSRMESGGDDTVFKP